MGKKIKILYISHSPYFNGAEICLLTLVRNINKGLFEPIIVFPYNGPLIEEMKTLGLRTYISPLERWVRYKYDKPVKNIDMYIRSQNIAKIIAQEAVDIVHTNTSVILEGAIAAKIKSIPHVWHIHEFLKGHSELHPCIPVPLIYEIMNYLSESIVSVSHYVKEQFKSIVNDEKITIIHNGVEENEHLVNNLIRDILKVGDDELIAVTIGLLTEAKGYNNFLEAAAIVHDKGHKIKFLWIGGGSKETLRNFKSKIKKLGLKSTVFYLDFRNDISRILKASDFLICPSTMETLSLAILEAMAAGLPVITTNCGGPSECVVDGETGFIVPVNNPVSLSEKIVEISCDEQKRKTFGENGRKRFMSNFMANKFAEKFENLYTKLIKNGNSKKITLKENTLIESFSQFYQNISECHWKMMEKIR